MTRNIIAEFSCSLDSNGNFKQYPVISGSTFSDEYSETLDSATILLSHVQLADRLVKIKPYDFVRVYDAASEYYSETGRYAFDHTYLVDNYNEKEDNIKERLFSYTIRLMSETKLLEKIQCPNLAITHDIKDGVIEKKTIFEKICEYMELYVPKIKMYNETTELWEYRPLIEIPGNKIVPESEEETKISEEFTTNFPPYPRFITKTCTFPVLSGELLADIEATTNNPSVSVQSVTFNSATGSFIAKCIGDDTETQTYKITFTYRKKGIQYYGVKIGYEDFYNKFNVPSADLGSAQYTLRVLLTLLMQQVSCIPTVNELKLGFLDFKDDNGNFDLNGDYTVDNTVNYINKSLSSDSFVNTIVNMSNNVLDSENEVISETVGFRDKSNVVLKQQQNLVLETKFPIYKINEFVLNAVYNLNNRNFEHEDKIEGVYTLDYYVQNFRETESPLLNGFMFDAVFKGHPTSDTLGSSTTTKYSISGKAFYYKINEEKIPEIVYQSDFSESVEQQTSSNKTITVSVAYSDVPDYDYYAIYFDMSGITKNGGGAIIVQSEDKGVAGTLFDNTKVGASIDLTKLVKETQERNLLETNFITMQSEAETIDDLARFIYGTVEYTIGSNTIRGFSSYWSQLAGTLFKYQYGKTYIETIYEWLFDHLLINYAIGDTIRKIDGFAYLTNDYFNIFNFEQFDATGLHFINFSLFTFDIKYQPLNSFNLAYVKKDEDIDFSIEQLNNADSGLADFDRLSLNQQESVDRIGNDTIFISQRISPEQFGLGYLRGGFPFKPVYYNRDGQKYTVFKRTYTVGNYKYDVSYVASKNAILQDYFTSIRTKYRAYQYIDYTQSTLRKEKDVFYVRIGENYYNGDDRVYFSQGEKESGLINGLIHSGKEGKLKYECEAGQNKLGQYEATKNDISLITTDNVFAIIYEQADNISAGSYIPSVDYTDYGYTKGEEEEEGDEKEDYRIGGVPQTWQEWNVKSYNAKHIVQYVSDMNFFTRSGQTKIFEDGSEVKNRVQLGANLPIITELYNNLPSTANVLYIVDNNRENEGRTFYKDLAERINHTVQFIYYSSGDSVKWTENFIANNSFVRNATNNANAIYSSNNMDLEAALHETDDTYVSGFVDVYVTVVAGDSSEPAHIKVNWNGNNIIKVCYKDNDGKVSDFIAFKRPSNNPETTKFYVTLNDTKSDYVMSIKNGVLYRAYKVKTNTMVREVENV